MIVREDDLKESDLRLLQDGTKSVSNLLQNSTTPIRGSKLNFAVSVNHEGQQGQNGLPGQEQYVICLNSPSTISDLHLLLVSYFSLSV